MEVFVGAQILVPAVAVEQVLWEWLDEDLSFKPDQMLVWVLSDEYGTAEKLLSVQGPGSVGQASKPKMLVNSIESWCS